MLKPPLAWCGCPFPALKTEPFSVAAGMKSLALRCGAALAAAAVRPFLALWGCLLAAAWSGACCPGSDSCWAPCDAVEVVSPKALSSAAFRCHAQHNSSLYAQKAAYCLLLVNSS